jgi:hypothetical protein
VVTALGFRVGALHAAGFHSGEFGGGRYSRYMGPPRFAVHRGPAFRGGYPDGYSRPFALRVYRNGYYEYHYYGCYDWRWAATPWGWRWRRVNVCYPSS